MAVRHLLLILATLHAQMPCGLLVHTFWPAERAAAPRDPGGVESRAHSHGCPCCHRSEPADRDPTPARAPKTPPECPADCQCMFCSVGFVPLTDFACTTQCADQAAEPLVPVAIPIGLAGHRPLLDRPPRLS